jgi:hypothetical protein
MIGNETVDEQAEVLQREYEAEREDLIEQIWAKLTEDNVACSCCYIDLGYISRVNEIGAIIDGRKWVMK